MDIAEITGQPMIGILITIDPSPGDIILRDNPLIGMALRACGLGDIGGIDTRQLFRGGKDLMLPMTIRAPRGIRKPPGHRLPMNAFAIFCVNSLVTTATGRRDLFFVNLGGPIPHGPDIMGPMTIMAGRRLLDPCRPELAMNTVGIFFKNFRMARRTIDRRHFFTLLFFHTVAGFTLKTLMDGT